MPFPPTCQSPVTCDNRPSRKVGNRWLCLACFEYTEHHKHLPIPEEPMSEPIHDQILAYVQKHGPTHMKQLSAALNIGMSSISSAAATLRRAGHITPASGDGVIRLTPAPADSALPDAVPDEDTVQTSEADVLRAEIGRLTESLATLHGVLNAQGLSTNPAELGNELDNIRASMLRSSSDNRELRAERSRCSAVRLEWSPWQQDSGIWETYLRLKTGNIDVSIGQIVYQHRIYEAALHHSDRDGGVTTTITGTSLADVDIVYVAAMQSAGLPVVSIPAIPESA